MQFKAWIFIIFLGLANTLFATPIPNKPLNKPNLDNTQMLLLPPPSVLNVLEIGTDWVKLGWPLVSGAIGYHIITREVATGNIIDDRVVGAVPASSQTVIIPNIPNVPLQSEITSIDSNGAESSTRTYSVGFKAFVIELVINGIFANPQLEETGDCTLGFPIGSNNGSPCTYTWSTNFFTYFKISKEKDPGSYRIFRVILANNTMTDVWEGSGAAPFTFTCDGRKLYIFYSGSPAATLSVSHATGSPQGNLFRVNTLNQAGEFKIERLVIVPELQSSEGESRSYFDEPAYGINALRANPNPFSDQLEVIPPFTDESQDLSISLYDLQGRQMLSENFPGGTQMLTLPTEHIAPGLYFLRAQSGEMSEIIRVLKTQ